MPTPSRPLPSFRFDPGLEFFIAPHRRGGPTGFRVAPHETLKHAIEALGVPHTEVGEVRVNGHPVPLSLHGLREQDKVEVNTAAAALPRTAADLLRFIADAHLARLARYLRFAGLDTLHRDDWRDAELATLAAAQRRIVLTRDRALLMHRCIERGCYLRSTDPIEQFSEVARRCGVRPAVPPASRCLLCNQALEQVPKARVQGAVPPRAHAEFDHFWRCPACRRVYWRGSHWRRMQAALEQALGAAGEPVSG